MTGSSDEKSCKSRDRKKSKKKHSKKKRKHSTDSSDEGDDRKRRRRSEKKRKSKRETEKGEQIEIPISLMTQSMAPMTKEQWEKQQSVVRKVYDETTGRQRLIKGDGEVVEEIVSRDRHKAINQQATQGDGQFFQTNVMTKVNK